VGKAARAWFLRLGWKNEIRGKVGDLYRDREDQIPSKSGFVLTGVESGSVACAGEEREKGGADRRVPPVRERKYGARWSEREEGKGGAVGLGRHWAARGEKGEGVLGRDGEKEKERFCLFFFFF
jgi:hypothetical protein